MKTHTKDAKKAYKDRFFDESFKTQYCTSKISIINRLILLRASFKEFNKTENAFTKYRSMYNRYNCTGLPN